MADAPAQVSPEPTEPLDAPVAPPEPPMPPMPPPAARLPVTMNTAGKRAPRHEDDRPFTLDEVGHAALAVCAHYRISVPFYDDDPFAIDLRAIIERIADTDSSAFIVQFANTLRRPA